MNWNEYDIFVRMFGLFEVENEHGTVSENRSTRALPWLLLKNLMCVKGMEVDIEEAIRFLWTDKEDVDHSNAARVRLRRLREYLAPIGLGGTDGLVVYHHGKYSLNPRYSILTDTDLFLDHARQAKKFPSDDPEGLQHCMDAITLMRGKFLAYTGEAPWFISYRHYYEKEFEAVALDTLERMKTLDDNRGAALLCSRVIQTVPENETLNKAIINYLIEQKDDVSLIRHISRLHQIGAAWVDNFDFHHD